VSLTASAVALNEKPANINMPANICLKFIVLIINSTKLYKNETKVVLFTLITKLFKKENGETQKNT
jgi:hypothetical protein